MRTFWLRPALRALTSAAPKSAFTETSWAMAIRSCRHHRCRQDADVLAPAGAARLDFGCAEVSLHRNFMGDGYS